MNYETTASIAQVFGILYFMAIFGLVLWYALSPKNAKEFEKASHIPLTEE